MPLEFDVPAGYAEMLEDFTIEVLRSKPENVVQFAAAYFTNLATNVPTQKLGSRYSGEIQLHPSYLEPPDPVSSATSVESTDESLINSDNDYDDMSPEQLKLLRTSVAGESFDPTKIGDIIPTKVFYPKTDAQRIRLHNAVKPILLFRCLDDEQLEEVVDAMFEKRVNPGEEIIVEGDTGDNFYVVESGSYDIFKTSNGVRRKVGNIVDSGSFGELALMYNTPRAATIISSTNGTLWAMDRTTFRTIVLIKAFQKRTRYEKFLKTVPLLSELSQYERMSVADALISKQFEQNTIIIKQGDPGEQMYFIETGEVVVTCKSFDETVREITKLGPGDAFGELALVTKKPRAATVTTITKTKVAVLDISSFERLLGPCLEIMKRNIDKYKEQMISIAD